MFEQILTPLDGSRVAASALPVATTLARAFPSRLILLSVVEPVTGGPTVPEIMAMLVKTFPDRRPEAMNNTVRGTLAILNAVNGVVITKADGARPKSYRIAPAKKAARK